MESGRRNLSKNPRQSANLLSVVFFGWSIPIFRKSFKDDLHANDALEPIDEDRSELLGNRLERYDISIFAKKPMKIVRTFKNE